MEFPSYECKCNTPSDAHGYILAIYIYYYGVTLSEGTATYYDDFYQCEFHAGEAPERFATVLGKTYELTDWEYTPIERKVSGNEVQLHGRN
jgi:hypothetical protein